MNRSAVCSIIFVLGIITCFGCGNKGPKVQMVNGTVKIDGEIVADADVCFTPKDGQSGIPAVGKTDASGVYTLTSAQGGQFGKGAVAGEYEVRVMKYLDLDYVEPVNPQPGENAPLANPKHHLPEKYADVKTSGLSATVKRGKNVIDFNLTKAE